MVPAVIYGAKQPATLIALEPKLVIKELQRGGWRSRMYEIDVDGTPSRALIREVQFHPVSDKPIHVDFQRLAPGQKIRVAVAVHFINEAVSPGIKKGGVLNTVLPTVTVLADPESVPEMVTADLGNADINATIRWSDLIGTENVAPVLPNATAQRDFVIATIAPPTKGIEVAAADAPAGGTKAPAKGGKAPAKPAAKK